MRQLKKYRVYIMLGLVLALARGPMTAIQTQSATRRVSLYVSAWHRPRPFTLGGVTMKRRRAKASRGVTFDGLLGPWRDAVLVLGLGHEMSQNIETKG